MPAGTPHSVITLTPSVTTGGHYLTMYNLHLTLGCMIRDSLYHHELSNAENPETQTLFMFATRYIHQKLISYRFTTKECLEKHFAQSHVPLPTTETGVLSLLAVVVFNELIFMFSSDRYPSDKWYKENKVSKRTRLAHCESRRLAHQILVWLDHHITIDIDIESEQPQTQSTPSEVFQNYVADVLHGISILRAGYTSSKPNIDATQVKPTVQDIETLTKQYLTHQPLIKAIYKDIEVDHQRNAYLVLEPRIGNITFKKTVDYTSLQSAYGNCSGYWANGHDGFGDSIQDAADAAHRNYDDTRKAEETGDEEESEDEDG